jgi:hypothetical protein
MGTVPSRARHASSDQPGQPVVLPQTGDCQRVHRWVGWMLRVNRVLGEDGRWAQASRFATAFAGGAWPGAAGESKISRWETAQVRIPRQALRRYEELLGLAPGRLTATASALEDYHCAGSCRSGSRPGQARLPAPALTRRVPDLIDKVGSGGVMTGLEWDELTAMFAATPILFITPATTWDMLAERLILELIRAEKIPWLHRISALRRLLVHPVGQQAAIATCANYAADPASQAVIEVICALDSTSHPDASHHILTQLTSPTSDSARYGALLACARKLRHGHFTSNQITHLASSFSDLARTPASHDDTQQLSASLLHQLPPATISRQTYQRPPDPALTTTTTTGRLTFASTAQQVIRPIVTKTLAHLHRDPPWAYDPTLATVFDQMLYHTNPDTRLWAAFLIAATPYRAPAAAALGAALPQTAVSRPGLATTILDALRIIGEAPQRAIAERLLLSRGLPDRVTIAAAHTLGHIGGTSSPTYWTRALDLHTRRWHQQRTPASWHILRSLIYDIAITRNNPILTTIRDHPTTPAHTRTAATWWLEHPTPVQQSANV